LIRWQPIYHRLDSGPFSQPDSAGSFVRIRSLFSSPSKSSDPSGGFDYDMPESDTLAMKRIHTRITRNGVHMAFVAMFAVLGGSVRGFNLLVILAGLMVGILLMQWRFCRATLPGLSVRRTLPREAFAGSPFKVRFSLTNHRRLLPAWLVRLEDRIRGGQGLSSDSEAVCSVGVVRPQASDTAHYDCTISRRGRYRFGPVRIATGFPFGLINAWKNTHTHATLVVYPALAKLSPHWNGILHSRREGLSATRHNSGTSEGEFFGIRTWRSGDSQRWIHWRTSARVGELAVRQFEQKNRTQLSLLLDPYLEADQDDSQLEWAISVAAAITIELGNNGTNRLAFGVADAGAKTLATHRVTDFRRAALTMLATVKPLPQPRLGRTLARLLQEGSPQWPVLIVSPRPARLDLLSATETQDGVTVPTLPPALMARLDLSWLDVTSERCSQIALHSQEANNGAI
jgi:uncharacterized protein (DUF58 family)